MKMKRRGPFLIQQAANSKGDVEVCVYNRGFLLHKRWGEEGEHTHLRYDRPRWAFSTTTAKHSTKHIR